MNNIKLFESKKIRSMWNEEHQQWYFSIIDIIRYATKRGFEKKKDALSYEQKFKNEKAGNPDVLFKDFIKFFIKIAVRGLEKLA